MFAKQRALLLAVALASANLAAPPAIAGGSPPEFDPERIEFATPTAQSSDCLGDLRTMICAAHTSAVCSVLRERPDCKALPYVNPFWNPNRFERFEYRIIAAGTVSRARYAEFARTHIDELGYGFDWVKPGLGQIRIRQRYCALPETSCEGMPWTENIVVLKPVRGGWRHELGILFHKDNWFVE